MQRWPPPGICHTICVTAFTANRPHTSDIANTLHSHPHWSVVHQKFQNLAWRTDSELQATERPVLAYKAAAAALRCSELCPGSSLPLYTDARRSEMHDICSGEQASSFRKEIRCFRTASRFDSAPSLSPLVRASRLASSAWGWGVSETEAWSTREGHDTAVCERLLVQGDLRRV